MKSSCYPHASEQITHERTDLHLDSAGVTGFRELVRVNFVDSSRSIASHIHPDAVEICYVAKGKQIYEAQGTQYLLSAGWIFISHPNEEHSSGGHLQEKNVQLYYMIIDTINDTDSFLGLSGADVHELTQMINALPHRFNVGMGLKDKFEEMFSLYIDKPPLWQTQLKCAAFSLLREIALCGSMKKPESEVSLYTLRTLNYIEDHLLDAQALSVQKLADNVYLSVPQLTARFRSEIGSSLKKYINLRRMQTAQDMLLEGTSITDVAFSLDFSSSQHFSNMFRSYFHCSPSQWLAQQQMPNEKEALDK